MRLAVVAFNLGGPDGPEAIRPFLFNLFSDPAIIGAPGPVRYLLAQWISRRRTPKARAIYAQIGGGSPILANTRAQLTALESALSDLGHVRAFPAMRYWRPMSEDTARDVAAFAPERVVLLPLYPQYSTATVASSLRAWTAAAETVGLRVPAASVCCYPEEAGFVAAMADLVAAELDRASAHGRPKLLLTAHGLPKKTVAAGDPYRWQVERTAAALVAALAVPDPDWTVCYQSRVGPLEWIGPYTDGEIGKAARDRRPIVAAPIAFVSEHSETLVELDIEYRHLAETSGAPYYGRVPTVSTHPKFIAGLAAIVRRALARGGGPCADAGARICPPEHRRCAMSDPAS